MKKLAIVLIAMIAMSGCTKAQVTCAVQTTVVNTTAQGIAVALQCSNLSAIESSLNTAAAGLNMCPTGTTLSLPSAFCQPFVNILVTTVAATAIPSAWGCTANVAQSSISALLLNACEGSPAASPSP